MPSLHYEPGRALINWTLTGTNRQPLLCLPGMGSSAAYLAAIAGGIDRPLALLDLPGNGGSEPLAGERQGLDAIVEVIIAVIETIGGGPLDVFGHSLGGTLAVAVAHARPDLVGALVVAEGNLSPGGGAASQAIAAQSERGFVSSGFADRMAALRHDAMAGNPALEGLFAARRTSDPAVLHRMASALVDLPTDYLSWFLSHPGNRVFIYGERTCPATSGDAPGADTPDPEFLAAQGAVVEIVPNAGHLMVIEEPAATAKAISRHLS